MSRKCCLKNNYNFQSFFCKQCLCGIRIWNKEWIAFVELRQSRGVKRGKILQREYLRMQVKGTLRCVIAILLDKGRELNVDLLLLTSLYHQALHRREMKSHADPQVFSLPLSLFLLSSPFLSFSFSLTGSFRRQSKLSLQILRRLGTITSRRTVW